MTFFLKKLLQYVLRRYTMYPQFNMKRAIRTVPLIAFQPTASNHKRLKPKKKLLRGRITQIINDALTLYFARTA